MSTRAGSVQQVLLVRGQSGGHLGVNHTGAVSDNSLKLIKNILKVSLPSYYPTLAILTMTV